MLSNLVAGTNPEFRHVVVEMMAAGECAEKIRSSGAIVHSLGMKRGRLSAAAICKFISLLRRERPALVQTWLYHADLLGLLAIPVLRVPVVWNIRSAWHYGLQGLAPRLCAKTSAFPAAVIVNSEAGRTVHQDLGYRPRRWCLIGNGFDANVFKPDDDARAWLRSTLGLASTTPLVGLVARWDPHKDHATFFAAAARLRKLHRDAHFVLVGEGLSPENQAVTGLVSDFQLLDCVYLLGRRDDIPRITAALDVASCTSVGEAFPNVVGEAMSAAVPCVATDVGDTRALVGDPDLIVPPRDPVRLANAWIRVLAMDPDSRRAKGLAARARIRQNHSLQAVIAQYEGLYSELLAMRVA